MTPRLFIVIPCYNEQEVLPITAPMFLEKLRTLTAAGKISEDSRVLFVNDGSKDKTWDIIKDLSAVIADINGIFSHCKFSFPFCKYNILQFFVFVKFV